MTALAPTLQAFFTDRLPRNATPARTPSPPTATRCACCSSSPKHKPAHPPPSWTSPISTRPLITAFLDHLEQERGNSVRTRNARLAAIHSLFRFAALRHPEHAALIQRVLAIPPKRADRAIVTFLTDRRRKTPCSPAPTAPPGPVAATTPGSSWPSRPDCGPLSSSA